MRPRFQWDAYDETNYQLSFLCNDPYKSIIQLVGCHNRTGVTRQFIMDNCKVKLPSPILLSEAVDKLQQQGLLRLHAKDTHLATSAGTWYGKSEYYLVNWEVIKAINNAIKRMP